MFKMVKHPTDCEIRSVIHFLNARNVKPADIRCQICDVYGQNAVSGGMVRKWVRKVNKGRYNIHDEPRSSRPSVVSDDLVHAVESKVCEDRRFTISSLSLYFQQISRTVLYEIVTSFGLLEIVLMLGAEVGLRGTQKEAGCQCIDHSHVIQ
jgi:transposase